MPEDVGGTTEEMSRDELKECLLCLRVPLGEILIHTYDLYEDKLRAEKVGIKAAEVLKEAYEKDRFRLCGKAPSVLMAASIYLAGLLVEDHKNQEIVSREVGVASVSLRNRLKDLMEILEIETDVKHATTNLVRKKAKVGLRIYVPSSEKVQCSLCLLLPDISEWDITEWGSEIEVTCPQTGTRIRSNSVYSRRLCNSFKPTNDDSNYKLVLQKSREIYGGHLHNRAVAANDTLNRIMKKLYKDG